MRYSEGEGQILLQFVPQGRAGEPPKVNKQEKNNLEETGKNALFL